MSRTNKKKKPPGYDYWGKRPYSGSGYGPEVKKLTKKKERADQRQKIHKIKSGKDEE